MVAYVAQVGAPTSAAGPLLGTFRAGMGLGNLTVGRWCPPAVPERLSLPLLGLGGPLLLMATTPPLAVAWPPSTAMAVTGAAVLASALALARHVRVPTATAEQVSPAAAVPTGR